VTFETFQTLVQRIRSAGTRRHAWALYGLIRWLQPRAVLEVGTWHGYTAAWMARALADNGAGRLHCIDNFSLGGVTRGQLLANLAAVGVADRVDVHDGDSLALAWPEPIDFAYLDGNHSHAYVLQECERALAIGARTIVLHDTTSWWGPRQFLDELRVRVDGVDVCEVMDDEGLTILRVRGDKPPLTYTEAQYPLGVIPAPASAVRR
jgi:predicted O-methyltransferase YrrM